MAVLVTTGWRHCLTTRPSVYTRVSYYRPWIMSVLAKDTTTSAPSVETATTAVIKNTSQFPSKVGSIICH